MEILSVTNKKTQLHRSPSDLTVICSNENTQKRGSNDISFFSRKLPEKCFVQISKTDNLDIWRIKKNKEGIETFDRIRKTKVEGIHAIACSKNLELPPEYAIGYTNGVIRTIDLAFASKNTYKHEFKADPNSNASVVFLDYSACGKYLSGVYENGIVNIYGLTTKIKYDTIKTVKDCSIARFNPSKNFYLAMSSDHGSIYIKDLNNNRFVFQEKEAHDAPIRDLCMPEDIPDRLITCGCDALIKIFDTRKRSTGIQISTSCGLNSVSVSKCGGFIVAGNLKGDVITFDMRSLRQPLAKMKADSELITRVAFTPSSGDSGEMPSVYLKNSSETALSDELPDIRDTQDDNSMMDDIIGFHKGRISEFDMSCSSRVSTFSSRDRMSDNFKNVNNALKNLSFSSEFGGVDDLPESPEVEEQPSSVFDRLKRSYGRKDSSSKRLSSLMPSPLQRIREEHGDKENVRGSLNTNGTPNNASSSLHTPNRPRFSSTPATVKAVNAPEEAGNDSSNEIIDVDALDSSEVVEVQKQRTSSVDTIVSQNLGKIQFDFDIKKEFEALHQKIQYEIQSTALDNNMKHIQMMSFVGNQNRELQHKIQMVEECMAILMNDDYKIERIMELQRENQELRVHLEETLKLLNR